MARSKGWTREGGGGRREVEERREVGVDQIAQPPMSKKTCMLLLEQRSDLRRRPFALCRMKAWVETWTEDAEGGSCAAHTHASYMSLSL